MLHNAICLVTAWRKIRFGFIITPMQLVNPNQVQILMLVVHLFQILPTYVPCAKVCARTNYNLISLLYFILFYIIITVLLYRYNTFNIFTNILNGRPFFLILKYTVSCYACELDNITIVYFIVFRSNLAVHCPKP